MAWQPSNPIPAMTSIQPLLSPVVVIGSQFLAPYQVDLKVSSKLLSLGPCNLRVTDNGALIFKVKRKLLGFHNRLFLLDAAGNIIATFRQKILTVHGSWQVFRGDSTSSQDLIFSVKRSSINQLKTELDVFFSTNTSEYVPDFKVKGSWFERSCTIYLGQSNTIIAQMRRKHTFSTILSPTDNFGVTVYPNVDSAFIVALLVILDEINSSND